jgi:lipopolysaccharide transport system ATP-binding protein
LHGRIGSLLEVGTGFHNELSGRENIYMNGAILGMKRSEIESKFDEIVAFSEIERFLDTPVKHYSSGMYMRLAFSIAAHLEPEILIVDEVLAVGDAAFQKKCLRKMRETGETGRTVLFVSHDMTSIARLCRRTIWISDGRIAADGETTDVIGQYVQQWVSAGAEKTWDDISTAPGDEVVRLRKVRICSESGETLSSTDIRRPTVVEFTYDVIRDGAVLSPNVQLYDERGTCIFVSIDQEERWQLDPRKRATYVSRSTIPGNLLAEGSIAVTVVIATLEPMNVHVLERDAVVFTVTDPNTGGTARANYAGQLPGVVRPILKWETEEISDGSVDI